MAANYYRYACTAPLGQRAQNDTDDPSAFALTEEPPQGIHCFRMSTERRAAITTICTTGAVCKTGPKLLLLMLGASILFILNAVGQGTVHFANDTSSRVTNSLTGQPLIVGSGYSAVLYYAPDGVTNESSFELVKNSGFIIYAFFNPAGVFNNSGLVRTPTNTAPGDFAMFQVRVWAGSESGIPYAAATSYPENIVGKSRIVRVQTGIPGTTSPGSLVASGLKGFSLVQAGMSVDDPVVAEGNVGGTNVIFTIQMARESSLPVSVSFQTTSGTALGDSDYISTNGVLVFAPGETAKTVSVPVIGDLSFEPTESFTLKLLERTNTFFTKSEGVARIVTDDAFLSIDDVSVAEGHSGSASAVLTVRLSEGLNAALPVQCSTSNGSALAGADFLATSGAILFEAGETTKSFSVQILGDVLQEPNETLFVRLNGVVGSLIQPLDATVTILDDDPLPSALHHFALSAVPSPQYQNHPFGLKVTALDGANELVNSFKGSVLLSGVEVARQMAIGSNTLSGSYLFNMGWPQLRQQVIYLASELPRVVNIKSLGLDISEIPARTLSNWTIRLKHTPLQRYEMPVFESNGWTIAYQSNQTITSTGWTTFPFSVPFRFNGKSNLLVDFSFNSSGPGYQGSCRYSEAMQLSVLRYFSSGPDPLSWSGTNLPNSVLRSSRPNVRLSVDMDVGLAPAQSDSFHNGVWSGLVTMLESSTNVHLLAQDYAGHRGANQTFIVEPSTDEDADGLPDSWELRHFGSTLRGSQEDTDGDRMNNREEFLAGTDPRSIASALRLVLVELRDGRILMGFMSVAGRLYEVERSDGLQSGSIWTVVQTGILGTGAEIRVSDDILASQHAFYRVRLTP